MVIFMFLAFFFWICFWTIIPIAVGMTDLSFALWILTAVLSTITTYLELFVDEETE